MGSYTIWMVVFIGTLSAMEPHFLSDTNQCIQVLRDKELFFSRIPLDITRIIANHSVKQHAYENDLDCFEESIKKFGVAKCFTYALDYLDDSPLAYDRFIVIWNDYFKIFYSDHAQYSLFDAILKKNTPQLKELIPRHTTGLDDYLEGYTALEVAFHSCNPEPVQILINAGASPQAVFGGLPLLAWAVCSHRPQVAKRMIAAGADVNARDHKRRSALHHAAKLAEVDCACLLLENKALFLSIDNKGEWPLHKALTRNNNELVRFLLHHFPPHSDTRVPIFDSLLSWSLEKETIEVPTLKELIKAGAFVDFSHNDQGKTLLHHAVLCNDVNRVRKLLALGADPCKKDDSQETPWDMARERNYVKIQQLCEQAIQMQQLTIDPSKIF